jgi:hypothetical protein
MNNRVRHEVESGLDHYDMEGRVFPKIAIRVSAGQELTKHDVLQIMAWKLGHIKESNSDTVSDENLVVINRAIKCVPKAGCSVDALETLENIHGIGLATATAILAVCYPEDFTIIDWRVSEMINFPTFLYQGGARKRNCPLFTASEYIADYLPMVKKQREVWGRTLHDTSRALCGLWVKTQIAELVAISSGGR